MLHHTTNQNIQEYLAKRQTTGLQKTFEDNMKVNVDHINSVFQMKYNFTNRKQPSIPCCQSSTCVPVYKLKHAH